jgi:NADH-quinone oxidoreductase subunit M
MVHDRNRGLRDLSAREWLVIAPICAAAIGMGVVPGLFLRPMEPAIRRTLSEIVVIAAPVNAAAPAAARPGEVIAAVDAAPPVEPR